MIRAKPMPRFHAPMFGIGQEPDGVPLRLRGEQIVQRG